MKKSSLRIFEFENVGSWKEIILAVRERAAERKTSKASLVSAPAVVTV